MKKQEQDRAREIAERCMELDEELERLAPTVEFTKRDLIAEIDAFVEKAE